MSAYESAIDARELSKVFGPVTALNKVSFMIWKGELFSFLGPNGAGKTTLLRLLSCILKPSSGTASVLGYDIRSDSLSIRRRIGIVPQWPSLYMDLNAVENFNFFAKLQGVRDRDLGAVRKELLDLVQLRGREKNLVGTYSGGMMRRLSIACALAHGPSIVFFDEPTSGLDPQTKRNIWKLMKDLTHSGVTVILNTHYMEEAEQLSDRVAIIDHGKVIAIDTTDSLKEMARSIEKSKATLEDVFIELTGEQLRE
jgi:ABC-2 type transport system ATP-binding protein